MAECRRVAIGEVWYREASGSSPGPIMFFFCFFGLFGVWVFRRVGDRIITVGEVVVVVVSVLLRLRGYG